MTYQRFIVNGKKMAKKKTKRTPAKRRKKTAKKKAPVRRKKTAKKKTAKKKPSAAQLRARAAFKRNFGGGPAAATKNGPRTKRARAARLAAAEEEEEMASWAAQVKKAEAAAKADAKKAAKKTKKKTKKKAKKLAHTIPAMRTMGVPPAAAAWAGPRVVPARKKSRVGAAGLAEMESALGHKKKRKPAKKTADVPRGAGPLAVMAAARAAVEKAEGKCEKNLLKMRAGNKITKIELDATKKALADAEKRIKTLEGSIKRIELSKRKTATTDLKRLKARQAESVILVRRTIQYYNTRGNEGQPVKRVRKGGKTKWDAKGRKKYCPPKTKQPGRKLRAGDSAGGKAVAAARWCAGVKTTVVERKSAVKRNFWKFDEDLL